ncbi:MAG: TRAP transporter permease [Opitutales bacterium]|nr:TRAP transporter permease [Opitutales bacterium]
MDSPASGNTPPFLRAARVAAALVFFAVLAGYFATGAGGPTLLAVVMVPVALVVGILRDWHDGRLYPKISGTARNLLGSAQVVAALAAAAYLWTEFEGIRSARLGAWTTADYAAGTTVVVLILEYTRRRYLPVFIVNVVLVLYCVYGAVVPGLLHHPGLSWRRVGSSLSLEMSTGVFERLPQLGLTLIGSFLLLLAALRAFGCIDSLLAASARIARRSPRLLPQAAVIGSLGVAAVSGSGAANAATTGSATIPMFIKAGFSRAHAAAVETAASLGGQLMPPLMGIAAFIMAEMMSVSYGEVMARGFAPALIYFLGVALAVHLLAARFQTSAPTVEAPPVAARDFANIAAYGIAVLSLVALMGYARWPAMIAAQRVFLGLLLFFTAVHAVSLLRRGDKRFASWLRPYKGMVDHFASTTAELTLLLASLGILTAAFTITGVPDKLGVLLLQLAEFNVLLMVLTAFAFGYLIGMGLPVTPTYIVLAIVTVPFMVRAGIDPWVAHFFAFFVAVFGELSPPTSVTAAVTSRIAGASFTRTMYYAMGLCSPLLALMVAVFIRPGLVAEVGGGQVWAGLPVLAGACGILLVLYGTFAVRKALDRALRCLVLGAAVAALLIDVPVLTVPLTTGLFGAVAYTLLRANGGGPGDGNDL